MPIKDLSVLLQQMTPIIEKETYFICRTNSPDPELLAKARGMFMETEGTTLILAEADMPEQITRSGPQALITLGVNSDLDAVGLLATIATALARHNISINVISAFTHDHLFVPKARATEAIRILHDLQIGRAQERTAT